MPILVRNITGREPDPPKCGCGTWIRHWEKNSKQSVKKCCALACFSKATDGGHVQRKDIKENSWFIIPLCHDCNVQFGKEFDVNDDTFFVPVGELSNCKS